MPVQLPLTPATRPGRLRADCARCFALCCVASTFAASADFAIDKPAGTPCPNLATDFRCGIHDGLRERGFPGCVVYDCFGAGQQVSQVTFGGRDWRRTPEVASRMFATFAVMRQLHELLWYLTEALELRAARPLRRELTRALVDTEEITNRNAEALAELDVSAHWREVVGLLRRASELARSGTRNSGVDHSGADLIGRNFRGADLSGASLRGAQLVGADLRGADLTGADLTGADLRGVDLRGADLTGCLFLTQAQLDAARGDSRTKVSPPLALPAHWTAAVAAPPRRKARARRR